MLVTVYTKPGCHLCEDALQLLDRWTPQYGVELREINILDDTAVYEEYRNLIPVIVAGDGAVGRLVAPIDEPELRAYLELARRNEAGDEPQVLEVPDLWFDRVAAWMGRHWLRLMNIALGIFVGLPVLAAVAASVGLWGLADPIYTAYALQCHQLPERAATFFGYEVAQCIRCSALYGGILFWGLLFGLARDRRVPWLRWLTRPIPWYVFAITLLPILTDGITHMAGIRDAATLAVEPGFGTFEIGSQMFSFNWWMRIATGLLAALGSVWFIHPRMDRMLKESEEWRRAYRLAAMQKGYVVNAPS